MIRVLLIGPLPPPTGGDTRHFATLAADLEASDGFTVTVVNTSRGEQHSNPMRNVAVAVQTLYTIAARARGTDVISFHASDRGMLLFGPFIVILGRLLGIPVILRVFGGSFGDFYRSGRAVIRGIVRRWVLSADIVLIQTRRAISQLQGLSSGRLEWFSTYIRLPSAAPQADSAGVSARPDRCSRFVFLGHLWRTKGVELILECAPHVPDDCIIDLFGPQDEYTADAIARRGGGRVQYRGLLSHEQVDVVLWRYDCLILPTFHPGEGYPGVIAEAFAHGLPVITTRWLAIPEIVDETCGILVEPENGAEFLRALTELHRDRGLWARLRAGARARAAQFDHGVWSRRFEELCEELVRT